MSEAVTQRRGRVGEFVLARIGNTPLLRLERVGSEFPNVEFLAKAEWFNPGGSVKDRPALAMIQSGIASGELRAGKTILDATSGNTGIAYAMIGAALGFPVTLCLPDSASHERKKILKALGAELIMTPGDLGTDGAIRRVQEILRMDAENIFIRISMGTRRIGRRITRRRRMRFGNRRTGGLRILWRGWGRAERLSAARGD